VLILRFCVQFELFLLFELFLALSCHFACLSRFSYIQLAFAVFLLLDDILKLFLAFWVFYLCFMRSWILTSNFVHLLSMDSSRGRLRNQIVSSLV
jgi:hypothetical protein